jgi:Tfp pilus assembly protein PilO
MRKVTLSQKKIIVTSLIVILVFLILWLFIYLPNQNSISRIKSEVLNLENQIKGIEEIMGKTRTIEGSIKLLKQRYQELNNKFPPKEEEGLRMLSDFAKRLNIELISIKPQPNVVFIDKNNKKIEIEGKTCHVVSVSMEVRCFYKDLVKYIETLNKALPAFAIIKRLRINRDKPETSRLNIKLDLNLYLLS